MASKEYWEKWYKEHPNYRSEYYQKNKEHIRLLTKQSYQRRLKERREYNRKYKQEHREYFIEWGRRLKVKLVKAMGGKCQNCGYSKCIQALEIHHLNPKEKEIKGVTSSLTKVRVRKLIKKWEDRKVLLLCANCHREFHYIKGKRIIISKVYI